MNEFESASQLRVRFMLDQARIADKYMAVAESAHAHPDIAARNVRGARRVLANINRFLAGGGVETKSALQIRDKRDRLESRLSALVGRA
jgi:hypothetical protein